MLKEVSHEISYGNTNSVISIKYFFKYVNKGSNVAMSGWQQGNSRVEVTQYQMDIYNSSNETLWRMFGFPLHERQSAIVQLAVHLENGQCVDFTKANAGQVAYIHTVFFNCAKILLLTSHVSTPKCHLITSGMAKRNGY